jgi:hypothetical protein
MVKKVSAQLYLPNESRIPFELSHTDLVKFPLRDANYHTVLTHMKKCLDEIAASDGM